MSRDIPAQSRNILTFRPVIDFIEPAVEAAVPNPVEVPVVIDDIVEAEKVRSELFNLAESVDVLATALQARIDLKAKDMVIDLDPIVDRAVLDAINRAHPDHDQNNIPYSMYKECREEIRLYADKQADKNNLTEKEVEDAGKDPEGMARIFDSAAAKNGSFRPERMPKAQLIEPIDIDKFQVSLLKILANFIWQIFILKAFDIKIGPANVKKLLPKNLPGAKLNKTEKKVLKKLKELNIPIPK